MKRLLAGFLALLLAMCLAGCAEAVKGGESAGASNVYELTAPKKMGLPELPREFPPMDAEVVFSLSAAASTTAVKADKGELTVPASGKTAASFENEMRAIWISYLDLSPMLTGKTEKQFSTAIGKAYDQIAGMGLNTVIVQVRPFGDALYPSAYFPWSYVATGKEGEDPGFDPLRIMLDQAKKRGLRFEAWVNPYRVRVSNSGIAMSDSNQAKKWLDAETGDAVQYGGNVYYNPASKNARNLIVNGIKEIVKNYDVDGIHIDDYFYPTTDAAFDDDAFLDYREGGGTMSLADWRRSNVEKLVKNIYKGVKEVNPNVRFGISPQANVSNNFNEQYFDSEKLLASKGYMDYICPQIYFGYQNAAYPYEDTVALWDRMITAEGVDLYIGIAAYKIGNMDQWAGTGKSEWLDTEDMLMRMVEDGRGYGHYNGFAIYRYDSLFNPAAAVMAQVDVEKKNLQSVLN